MEEEFLNSEDVQAALNDIKESAREYDPDLEVFDIEGGLPKELQFHTTATTAYKTGRRPRTLRAAYDHANQIMYVVFYGGVYFMYVDVPPIVWDSFKSSASPGNFLWNEGFDARGPKGAVYAYQPVDMTQLSPARKAALASSTRQAEIRQEGLRGKRTVRTLYPKGTRYKKPNRGGF